MIALLVSTVLTVMYLVTASSTLPAPVTILAATAPLVVLVCFLRAVPQGEA